MDRAGLQLFGRMDAVFKLANGEKVSGARWKARMAAAHAAAGSDGGARVWPAVRHRSRWISPGAARRWLEERQLAVPEAQAGLTEVPELRRAIVEALQAANLLAAQHYERVRRVALVPELPAVETGDLTPTLKMVRAVVTARQAAPDRGDARGAAHPQIPGDLPARRSVRARLMGAVITLRSRSCGTVGARTQFT